jgi:hypothetical protein
LNRYQPNIPTKTFEKVFPKSQIFISKNSGATQKGQKTFHRVIQKGQTWAFDKFLIKNDMEEIFTNKLLMVHG